MVAPHYGLYNPTSADADLIPGTTPFNFQIDLNETTRDFTFTLPYISETARKRIYNGPHTGEVKDAVASWPHTLMGYLNFYVVNPISLPSATGQICEVNVFVGGADDYCPSGLFGNNQSIAPTNIYWPNDASISVKSLQQREAEGEFEDGVEAQANEDGGNETGTVSGADTGLMSGNGGENTAVDPPIPTQQERVEDKGIVLGPAEPILKSDPMSRYDGTMWDQIKTWSPLVTLCPEYHSADIDQIGWATPFGSSASQNINAIRPGINLYTIPVCPPVNTYQKNIAKAPPGQAGLFGYYGSMYASWMGDINYRILVRVPPGLVASPAHQPTKFRLYAFYLADNYDSVADATHGYVKDNQSIGMFITDNLRLQFGDTKSLEHQSKGNFGVNRVSWLSGSNTPDEALNVSRGIGSQMAGARTRWWVCDETAPYLELSIPYNGITQKKMVPVDTAPFAADASGTTKKYWADSTLKNFFYMGRLVLAYVNLDNLYIAPAAEAMHPADLTPKLEIQIAAGDNFHYMDFVGNPTAQVRHSYSPGDANSYISLAPDSYTFT